MTRTLAFVFGLAIALAGCAKAPEQTIGADGRPLPQVYRLSKGDAAQIEYRVLDSVNALREADGQAPLALSPELTAAAATHSRDMSVQNRPWHFGSDGSSPLDRVRRTGYPGIMLGENISETYETETETLAAWMAEPDTRAVVLDAKARDMGFAYYQESSGKIWWTMVTGG